MFTLILWLSIFTYGNGRQVPHTFITEAQCVASVQSWFVIGLEATGCVPVTVAVEVK